MYITVLFSVIDFGFARLTWHPSFRIYHPYLHHGLAPMSESEARWGKAVYDIRVNSLGMKDSAARRVPAKASRHRIVFLGDSFTEGIGLDYKDTFVGRFGNIVRAATGDRDEDDASSAGDDPT